MWPIVAAKQVQIGSIGEQHQDSNFCLTWAWMPIDKELIIRDLGVSLFRFELPGSDRIEYKPVFYVKVDKAWKMFPWSSEEHLKKLYV